MKTSGNTILITGGTAGIGKAFAEQFFKEGNTIIICGRRAERLEQMKEAHPGLITRVCDLANEQLRTELCEWVIKNYPTLNVLINNAGMQLAVDLTKPVDLKLVREELETNLIAYIHLSSLLVSHLETKKDAVIINISSGLAFAPLAFMPIYCASKAAVHSYTLSLRHQLKKTSVKVYEIAPPSTDTELGHQRRADKTQSHGGAPISEFLAEAMEGLKNDISEIAVGESKGLRAKREELFNAMNH
jgi:uncharacterized oxidoreductase